MRLAQAMRKKKRQEHLNWFPPAETALKRTLIQNLISVLQRSRSPLNFASLSSPSSLTNSYTFLVGIWRIIKDLARSALATIPGRRRRVLFLVRLKNRKIFSLRFLCLSRNAHDSGGIFSSRKWKKLGNPTRFQG